MPNQALFLSLQTTCCLLRGMSYDDGQRLCLGEGYPSNLVQLDPLAWAPVSSGHLPPSHLLPLLPCRPLPSSQPGCVPGSAGWRLRILGKWSKDSGTVECTSGGRSASGIHLPSCSWGGWLWFQLPRQPRLLLLSTSPVDSGNLGHPPSPTFPI